jgi:glycosyltransferase involved in cell wall biosynthesis
MNTKPLRVDRIVVVTPMMAGADGISEMTRQWVRALEARVGRDVGSLEVWSLDDARAPAFTTTAVRFQTAHGGRLRFGSFAARDGIASAAGTVVVVMHVQLLPVALPLVWRGARLLPVLMGIEAWVPLPSMQSRALQQAWKVAAISAHTATRFRETNPSAGGIDITVCRPGVPLLEQPCSQRIAGPYALIVGRMNSRERYKGHDALIDMWPHVRRTVPGARLVIAGDGDDAPRLRGKAGEDIEFTGCVDRTRLAALYRDAAFFVMPSPEEGFGLVYLEAMSAATPCIAAPGAAEEIITHGRDGLIVDAADGESLLEAMLRLFVDHELRSRMGAAAAQRVAVEFDASAVERRVRKVLELEEA